MNIKEKINKRNISLALCFLIISAYIIFGNCLTFNIGNRMPIKVAEIIALIGGITLLIIHKKDLLKIDRNNIKILIWFAIALIPMILIDYSLKQIVYGILYPIGKISNVLQNYDNFSEFVDNKKFHTKYV